MQTAYIDRVKSQPRTSREAAVAIIGEGSENALAEEAARRLERLNQLRSAGVVMTAAATVVDPNVNPAAIPITWIQS